MPTVSARIAEVLAHYVDHVFGVMGNGNAYLLDALERDQAATFTAVRNEAGAVVAADAHYRSGGGLAAATTTYGPGFSNTLTSLAESALARIPLVLITGDAPTSGSRPWDVDQTCLAAAVGVETFTVGAQNAGTLTAEAIQYAVWHRMPVVLAIPYDLAATPVTEEAVAHQEPAPAPLPVTDTEALAQVSEKLRTASGPLLLAGRGAHLSGAGPVLAELAEATGALTATTALARGLFQQDERDLGVAGGFGAEGAMETVREADLVIVVGASLNQFTMRFGDLFAPETTVVQIDTAEEPTNPRVNLFLRGDATRAAGELLTTVRASGATAAGSGWQDVDTMALRRYEPGEEFAGDGRLDPRALARAIGELLPEERVVVSDGGHFIAWANMYWPVTAPERMVMVGTAYQAIGQGFPSVAGAVAAHPGETVVLTTGDGGGLMALADLETAVRTAGGHGMAVVWNDAAYGAEVNLYGLKGLAPGPMHIRETDFAALASALGAQGVVVRSHAELEHLRRWRETPAAERPFLLLDCRISTEVIAPYQEEVIRMNSGR